MKKICALLIMLMLPTILLADSAAWVSKTDAEKALVLFINRSDNLFAINSNPSMKQPKPDFSVMEKWYEIVRYEYGDLATDNRLYFWVKKKVKDVPGFCMQFLDKDGVLVTPDDPWCGQGIYIDLSEVGQVTKAYCYTPYEKNMEKVVSAKVVRPKG